MRHLARRSILAVLSLSLAVITFHYAIPLRAKRLTLRPHTLNSHRPLFRTTGFGRGDIRPRGVLRDTHTSWQTPRRAVVSRPLVLRKSEASIPLLVARAGTGDQFDGGKKPPKKKKEEGGGGGGDDEDPDAALKKMVKKLTNVMFPIGLSAILVERLSKESAGLIQGIAQVFEDISASVNEAFLDLKHQLGNMFGGGGGDKFYPRASWSADGGCGDGGMGIYGMDYRSWMEPDETDLDQADMDLGELRLAEQREKRKVYGERKFKRYHNKNPHQRIKKKMLFKKNERRVKSKRKTHRRRKHKDKKRRGKMYKRQKKKRKRRRRRGRHHPERALPESIKKVQDANTVTLPGYVH
ncbi:hypothetical protein AAMO2058_000752000 [Amorphochlora amoebiformis]